MYVVRPITKRDTEAFIDMAFKASGMTSLPKNRALLQQKIADSEHAFATYVEKPGNEKYIFVLENLSTHTIGGICGIDAKTGIDHPLYFYHIEESQESSMQQSNPIMRIVEYRNGPSEIRSLFLTHELRREGVGRLLSLSRFLFIATHRPRFDDTLFAEMRGYVDGHGHTPFWEGIGQHFFDMDIDQINALRDQGLITTPAILPHNPIYISLLPPEVVESIGKVHDGTQPALKLLVEEGFHLTNDVDVFDGGPKIEAKTDDIREVGRSLVATIAEISSHPIDAPRCIACNNRLDFRACYASLAKDSSPGVVIAAEVAEALHVKVGDTIRYTDVLARNREPSP